MNIQKTPSPQEIEELVQSGKLYKHHTAAARGYISRKTSGYIEPYSGRFGSGYVWRYPRWDTTQYVYITYYIYR